MARRFLLEFEKPLVELENQIDQIRELARDSEVDVSQQLLQLETLAARRRDEIFSALTPAQKIQVARHPQRPSTLDYIQMFCCLLYTSPSPRDSDSSRMPSSA